MGEMKPAHNSRTKRQVRGRRFYVGDIQTDKISYINIDIQWKRCYVRAQAYTKTKEGTQPVVGAEVTLIGKENADGEQYYGYTKAITNKNGIACIPAWCDSNVVLQSSKLSYNADGSQRVSRLNADDRVTLVKLPPQLEASVLEGNKSTSYQFTAKVTSQAGPVFAGDEMNKCLDLSDTLVAFGFYLEEKEIKVEELEDFGSRPPGHPLSWYTTDASRPNQEPNKCFMKIRTEYDFEGPVPMVSVQSFTPNREIRYGFSIKEQTPTQDLPTHLEWDLERYAVAYACVEYRCSEIDKDTFLVVTLLTDGCVFPRPILPLRLKAYNNATFTSRRSTSFYAPFDISDGKLGLYTGPGKIAEERCKAGREVYVAELEGTRKIKSAGYAVEAVDAVECSPDETPGWWRGFRQQRIGPN